MISETPKLKNNNWKDIEDKEQVKYSKSFPDFSLVFSSFIHSK